MLVQLAVLPVFGVLPTMPHPSSEADMAKLLLAYDGREIIFGIRPEDLYDKLFIAEAPGESTVTSTVEVVEPMGSEVYLHLKAGRYSLVARVSPQARPEVNQDLDLVFDMGKAHFFDPTNEQAIQ